MSERVLVTGAQGFLGRYLVAQWLDADPGATVVGCGRSPRLEDTFTHRVHWNDRPVVAPLPEPLPDTLRSARYRYVALDVHRRPELIELLQELRPTVLVHLAASLRDAAPDRLVENNVRGTVSVLEAIAGAAAPPPRVILGSSGAVYGDPGARLPIHESQPCAPCEPYGVSKRAAEDLARVLARLHGLDVVFARIFNPLGPGQDERHFCGWVARQAAAIAAGLKPPVLEVGPLVATRDFVDVRDVAAALCMLAAAAEPGRAYNVGSGVETPIREVLHTTLRLAAVDGGVHIETRPGRPVDVPRHCADITALRELGWQPRHSLEQSVGDVLAYYRDTLAPRAASHNGAVVPPAPPRIDVRIERHHGYAVEVAPGLVDELPQRLTAMLPGARLVLLSDETVFELHGATMLERLAGAGASVGHVVLGKGERSKAMQPFAELIAALHEQRLDRRGVLVCLGGGMITDLGGFAAASYLRGVAYVSVPTTLIGQHDAAIGGKVAINMPWAKNFVGAFWHPHAVFCDPTLLKTLDARNLGSGIAEAIKVAICGEPTLFMLLEDHVEAIRDDRDPALLCEVVRRAARKKVELLSPDPHETDLRRVLNLGHTFGHPLETELAYAGILHGEAVAFGLAVATVAAHDQGLCERDAAERILALLAAYQLPPPVPKSRLRACLRHMDAVRLVRGNRLNFVYPTGIAATTIVPEVDAAVFERAIETIERHPRLGHCVVED